MFITIKQPVSRLAANSEGLALTEFAFALPVVLVLTMGGLETANYAFAHMRISQLAMTTADNAGRVKNVIDEANIYEVFEGADLVGESIDFADNGRVVLSSLQHNGRTGSTAGQMINWQRCFGSLNVTPAYGLEGVGRTNNSLASGMGETGNRITSLPNTAVMFVEVSYEYQPLISSTWIGGDRTIRYESAFNVRERVNQDITNTQSLDENDCGAVGGPDDDDDD